MSGETVVRMFGAAFDEMMDGPFESPDAALPDLAITDNRPSIVTALKRGLYLPGRLVGDGKLSEEWVIDGEPGDATDISPQGKTAGNVCDGLIEMSADEPKMALLESFGAGRDDMPDVAGAGSDRDIFHLVGAGIEKGDEGAGGAVMSGPENGTVLVAGPDMIAIPPDMAKNARAETLVGVRAVKDDGEERFVAGIFPPIDAGYQNLVGAPDSERRIIRIDIVIGTARKKRHGHDRDDVLMDGFQDLFHLAERSEGVRFHRG